MVRRSASTGIPWNVALSSALLARSVRTTRNGTPLASTASIAGVESPIGQSSDASVDRALGP
jgi:hypothetical protein